MSMMEWATKYEKQLDLGEIVDQLTLLAKRMPLDADVMIDTGRIPTGLASYRGAPEDMVVEYLDDLTKGVLKSSTDMSDEEIEKAHKKPLARWIEDFATSDGAVFEGWKGGAYPMSNNTPVWVSKSGGGDARIVVGVAAENGVAIIKTLDPESGGKLVPWTPEPPKRNAERKGEGSSLNRILTGMDDRGRLSNRDPNMVERARNSKDRVPVS